MMSNLSGGLTYGPPLPELGLGSTLAKLPTSDPLKAVKPVIESFKPVIEPFNVAAPTVDSSIEKIVQNQAKKGIAQVGEDVAKQESGFFDNLLGDEFKMGNIATAAGLAMQLASLPAQFKSAKLANQAAVMNNQAFKEDRDSFKRAKANYSNIRFT